jgi:hypothetical protein
MVKHNMVIGLPKVVPPNGVCEGCMVGKHQYIAFKTKILGLIVSFKCNHMSIMHGYA